MQWYSVFQMRAPVTGKAREPMEVSQTVGTIRSSEVEDRSLWREEGTSATRTNCHRMILWYVAGQTIVNSLFDFQDRSRNDFDFHFAEKK